MKIGVITYFCVPNFGAQLQVLSTLGALRNMGHEAKLINWYPRSLENIYKRYVSKAQRNCQLQFARDQYPLTSLCRKEDDLLRVIEKEDFDMIFTGSDALFRYVPQCNRFPAFSWRKMRYVNNYTSCEDIADNPFFCTYYPKLHKKIPVVAFSVSSQSCPFYLMTKSERDRMSSCMKNFRHITVRDEWTQKMVTEVAGIKDVPITPDPVFAFNSNIASPLPNLKDLVDGYHLPENYALVSFPVDSVSSIYVQQIADLLKERGITLVALPVPEGLNDFGLDHSIPLPLDPLTWYALIVNSRGYIGTRMHPVIVCLHNAIPFFSYDGNGTINADGSFNTRSSKTYDILLRAGLQDNIFMTNSGAPLPSADSVVDHLLSFDREKCASFANVMRDKYNQAMFTTLKYAL